MSAVPDRSVSFAPSPLARVLARLVWGLAALLAVAFASHAAARFLVFTQASYGPLWVNRHALLVHFVFGAVALLVGLAQFSSGLRARRPDIHRWTGRIYLSAVAVSVVAAWYMAFHSVVGWMMGVATFVLGLGWALATGMGWLAILRRQYAAHREWMIRSYVLTFAFVFFRIMAVSPLFADASLPQRFPTLLWLSFTVPLMFTEVVLQWRRSVGPAGGTNVPYRPAGAT